MFVWRSSEVICYYAVWWEKNQLSALNYTIPRSVPFQNIIQRALESIRVFEVNRKLAVKGRRMQGICGKYLHSEQYYNACAIAIKYCEPCKDQLRLNLNESAQEIFTCMLGQLKFCQCSLESMNATVFLNYCCQCKWRFENKMWNPRQPFLIGNSSQTFLV